MSNSDKTIFTMISLENSVDYLNDFVVSDKNLGKEDGTFSLRGVLVKINSKN